MNIDGSTNQAILPADFARRVVEGVREARRRGRLRRRVLTGAAICAAVVIAASLSIHNLRPAPASMAARSPRPALASAAAPAEPTDLETIGVSDPLAFFFPGAAVVADFQSTQANYWHSYDPWWNPNPESRFQ